MEIRLSRLNIFPKNFVGHILFKPSPDGSICGIALDHGIIMEADNLEDAQTGMVRAIEDWIERCIEEDKLDELFAPSPARLWAELEQGSRLSIYEVTKRQTGAPHTAAIWPLYQALVDLSVPAKRAA